MVFQVVRSATRGRIVPIPLRPDLATRLMNRWTSTNSKRPRRSPVSRQCSTNRGDAVAPTSTTVRTAEVVGMPSTVITSPGSRSTDSWICGLILWIRRCRTVTTSARWGSIDVRPQMNAAVLCEAAARPGTERTSAVASRCHVAATPGKAKTVGWTRLSAPRATRLSRVDGETPTERACDREKTPCWLAASGPRSRSKVDTFERRTIHRPNRPPCRSCVIHRKIFRDAAQER